MIESMDFAIHTCMDRQLTMPLLIANLISPTSVFEPVFSMI